MADDYDKQMRKKMIFKFGVTIVILIAVYLYYVTQNEENNEIIEDLKNIIITDDTKEMEERENNLKEKEDVPRSIKYHHWKESIHIAVVACGDRGNETVILLKSALLLTEKHLIFHIFAESQLQPMFKQMLDSWPSEYQLKMNYFIYNLSFPDSQSDEWKKLFKTCASQRLFIPSLLTDVDSLLYVDTDILFLRDVGEIWKFFNDFNSTQLAAVSPEHEDAAIGWYNRFARHPYYGKLGINSGVMLMNLTRLRNSDWIGAFTEYYKEYRLKITWGDQDLINIYFHFHPDQIFVFSCEWNYRPDHCMYMSVCKDIEVKGISVLHGCRRVMHNDKQPAFKAVYTAFKEHQFSSTIKSGLLNSLKRELSKTSKTPCGKLGPIIYTKHIEEKVQKGN